MRLSRLSLSAALLLGCAPTKDSAVVEGPSESKQAPAPDLIGTKVMISFTWERPTSVLGALTVVGTLVREDKDVLVVKIDGPLSESEERELKALESRRKIERDDLDPTVVRVFREGIERVSPYPKL